VVRPFDPCRIADQLWIGVHQLVAFLLLCAYLFRTVFLYLFAYLHSTASHRHPLRASARRRESVVWCRLTQPQSSHIEQIMGFLDFALSRPIGANLVNFLTHCDQIWKPDFL
jgi:hypothetical protein